MVTKTTVVCWFIGILGVLGFLGTVLNIRTSEAGEYFIFCTLVIVSAMYFNIKYKDNAKNKSIQKSLDSEKSMQETLDREMARIGRE